MKPNNHEKVANKSPQQMEIKSILLMRPQNKLINWQKYDFVNSRQRVAQNVEDARI